MRLIGAFGRREMELAAIRILDRRTAVPIRDADFPPDGSYEHQGFKELITHGWLLPVRDGYVASQEFLARCIEHGERI